MELLHEQKCNNKDYDDIRALSKSHFSKIDGIVNNMEDASIKLVDLLIRNK